MQQAVSSEQHGRGRLQPWSVPVGLWVAALLGLALRLHLVLVARPTCEPYDDGAQEGCRSIGGDALFFFEQARRLADGDWYVNPFVEGRTPMAGDPPLFAGFLAVVSTLGIDTPAGQRVVTAVLGAVGVVLIGLVAGRLAGRRAAVVAGVLAAAYPMLWINDGQLMSESLYIPIIAVLLLALLQLWDRPTVGRALLVGALVSLAALTRGEALVFFALVVAPLVLFLRDVAFLRRLALLGVAGAAGALVLAPWFLFNLSRFDEPTTMSSQTASVLLSSACDAAYDGDRVGYYSFECLVLPISEQQPVPLDADKSVEDAALRETAQRYLTDNLGELPRVAAFRVGRVWEVYRPAQNAELNAGSEDRGLLASQLGLAMYYVLVPFAVGGLVVLRRRRLPISPYLGMALTATLVAAMTFGVTRYRVPVDVCLVVLAGVAVDALWGWLASRRARGDAERDAWDEVRTDPPADGEAGPDDVLVGAPG